MEVNSQTDFRLLIGECNKKGTVIGQLEEVSLIEHGDPCGATYGKNINYPRMSKTSQLKWGCRVSGDQLKQLTKEFKISYHCSDSERRQLLDNLVRHEQVFNLCDEELGEIDVVELFGRYCRCNSCKRSSKKIAIYFEKTTRRVLLLKIN